jgi:hypothetical protein
MEAKDELATLEELSKHGISPPDILRNQDDIEEP